MLPRPFLVLVDSNSVNAALPISPPVNISFDDNLRIRCKFSYRLCAREKILGLFSGYGIVWVGCTCGGGDTCCVDC
ncbi:hypothetical protein BDR03DRAFT_971347 [Suillus americanus]|nr:hypothetical protein BDR03DRAFT_971347 [Suillus americanus]